MLLVTNSIKCNTYLRVAFSVIVLIFDQRYQLIATPSNKLRAIWSIQSYSLNMTSIQKFWNCASCLCACVVYVCIRTYKWYMLRQLCIDVLLLNISSFELIETNKPNLDLIYFNLLLYHFCKTIIALILLHLILFKS